MPKVISATDVVGSRRGRKPQLDDALVKVIGKMGPDDALVFDASDGFAKTTPEDSKVRQAIRGSLATHWKHSGQEGDPSIIFSPDGWPQLRRKVTDETPEATA